MTTRRLNQLKQSYSLMISIRRSDFRSDDPAIRRSGDPTITFWRRLKVGDRRASSFCSRRSSSSRLLLSLGSRSLSSLGLSWLVSRPNLTSFLRVDYELHGEGARKDLFYPLESKKRRSFLSAIGNFSSKFSQRHSSLLGLILDAGCAMVSLYVEIRHLFGTIMFIECTFRQNNFQSKKAWFQ